MLPEIKALLVLQDRDRRIRSITEQLDKLPSDESRAKGQLKSDHSAVEAAKKAVQENEIEIKKVELDVETRRTTIIRLKKQQFETRKNEEFTALGHEITRYEQEVDDLETTELELMESGDALRAALASAGESLAKTERLVAEDLESIAERGKNLSQERSDTQAERDQLATDADQQTLGLYDRLMKTKNGLAVVPLHNGQCGGCHVKLVAATVIKAQGEKDMAQCENCARILYVE